MHNVRIQLKGHTMKTLFIPLILMLLSNYTIAQEPSKVYETYNQKFIEGWNSIEEEKAFYTQKAQDKLEKDITLMSKSYKDNSRQKAISFYHKLAQTSAACKNISLQKETITGDSAILVYKLVETCYPAPTDTLQEVHMMNVNGWKIDSSTVTQIK